MISAYPRPVGPLASFIEPLRSRSKCAVLDMRGVPPIL